MERNGAKPGAAFGRLWRDDERVSGRFLILQSGGKLGAWSSSAAFSRGCPSGARAEDKVTCPPSLLDSRREQGRRAWTPALHGIKKSPLKTAGDSTGANGGFLSRGGAVLALTGVPERSAKSSNQPLMSLARQILSGNENIEDEM